MVSRGNVRVRPPEVHQQGVIPLPAIHDTAQIVGFVTLIILVGELNELLLTQPFINPIPSPKVEKGAGLL